MFIFKITYISILGIPLAVPYVALDLSIWQTHAGQAHRPV